jgi:RsbT co-antagonist protein rsbRD N-terminal domain
MVNTTSKIPGILAKYHNELLSEWVQLQLSAPGSGPDLMSDSELRRESAEFLGLVREAMQNGDADLNSPQWAKVRDVLSMQPLFDRLRREFGNNSEMLVQKVREGPGIGRGILRLGRSTWTVLSWPSPANRCAAMPGPSGRITTGPAF